MNKDMKIKIVKNKDGKLLIGSEHAIKEGIRLNVPFEIKKTEEGITLTPYDVEFIDTYIPFINFFDFEYIVEPEIALANFYRNSSKVYIAEVKDRIEALKTKKE